MLCNRGTQSGASSGGNVKARRFARRDRALQQRNDERDINEAVRLPLARSATTVRLATSAQKPRRTPPFAVSCLAGIPAHTIGDSPRPTCWRHAVATMDSPASVSA